MAQKVKRKKTGPGKQTGANKLTRLRGPEKKLAACVRRGERCIFDPSAPEKTRTIRAEVIERLVRGRPLPGEKAALDLPPKGLAIVGAKISGPLDLSGCDCLVRLGFPGCEFDSPIDLKDARLRGLFLLRSSLQGLEADRLTVEGPLEMGDIRSKGMVRLNGAAITGDLNLRNATLENTDKDAAAARKALNLQKLTVSGTCFFDKLAQPPIGHVDLTGMSASDLVDDKTLWPEEGHGDLWLDGFTYNRFGACETGWRFRQSWLLRQAPRFLGEDFAPQPWVQCAKVLREMGHERDARILLYHMHEARRGAWPINWHKFHTIPFQKNFWRSLGSQILRGTAGHGYRPGFSLAWIAGIMFFGAVIFSCAQSAERMTPAKERFYLKRQLMLEYELTGVLPSGYPKFSPILYSVDVFLPIVSFSQEDHWRPTNLPFLERLKVRWWKPWTWNKYRFYNRLHIILGWFFTSIAVFAFTRVIKRD